MMIQVHFTKNYMKFDLIGLTYFNIGNLNFANFRQYRERRIKFIKSVFDDNAEYDIVHFFHVLEQLRSFRITEWITDNVLDEYIKKFRKELEYKT